MKIIQISDLHLHESENSLMDMGPSLPPFSTEQSFQKVREKICKDNEDCVVIISGDIAQEPSKKAYQRIAKLLHELPFPCYCLAGNHDKPSYLKTYFNSKNLHNTDHLDLDKWRVIFLDTSKSGHPDGHLTEEQLKNLKSLLKTKQHVLIAMHHHPIPINSKWMDDIRLQEANSFLQIVNQHQQIKAVIFGHIHQEFDEIHNGTRYLGNISTCIQFTPNKEDMIFSNQTPGYREINLLPNGTIKTSIQLTEE